MFLVGKFLQHANEIFSTARTGSEDCDLAILMSRNGGIHIVDSSGWNLDPLRIHHDAEAVYRIWRHGGGVQLEARASGQSCVMRSENPAHLCRGLFADFPQYLTLS